ncbi:MAG TPA: hemerythrin domain-containing protein [Marmoricola sp.]
MVTLAEALTLEHREIDRGIEEFVEALDRGAVEPAPLLGSIEALRRHIYLEEAFLFPPVRQAGLMMPVMVMLREHGELWRQMDAVTDLVDGAGADSSAIESKCRELLAMLDQHNMKEEPIIYPHADADLPTESSAELRAFLEAGSTPDGWVCEGAR